MKILHIDTEKTWRGGQQQAYYLHEGLLKRNIHSGFVCPAGSQMAKRLKENNMEYFTAPLTGEFDLVSAAKIAFICKKHGYDILHLHSAHAQATGLFVKMLCPTIKLVAVRRVDFHIKKNFLSRFKYTTSLIDKIVCVSDAIKNILVEDGVSSEKLITIHSGINLNKFDNKKITDIRPIYSINKDSLIVGTVAALVGHKDYPNLLRAAKIVLEKRNDIVFIAVGDGKDVAKIRKLGRELKLGSRFVFAGYQTDIASYIKSFNIFTMASKTEGLGTSLLDALSVGLPAIGSDTGGIPEIISHNETGLLVPPQNHKALADAILKLASNPELRSRLAQTGKSYVHKFGIDNTVEKNIKLYKQLLGS